MVLKKSLRPAPATLIVITSMPHLSQDLTSATFNLGPRRSIMTKHSEVATEIIGLAKNGVIGQVCTRQALEELLVLEPWLVNNMDKKAVESLVITLNRGLRTLLSWYRLYKEKPLVRKQVLKGASGWEETLLDRVVEGLVMSNEDLEVGMASP